MYRGTISSFRLPFLKFIPNILSPLSSLDDYVLYLAY